jgi:uncharacterized membrane protein
MNTHVDFFRFIWITPLIFGIFVVFSAGGEAIVSWVVARNLEHRPMDMMYAETAANFLMILIFGVMYYLLRLYRRKYHPKEEKEEAANGGEPGAVETPSQSRAASPDPLQPRKTVEKTESASS